MCTFISSMSLCLDDVCEHSRDRRYYIKAIEVIFFRAYIKLIKRLQELGEFLKVRLTRNIIHTVLGFV